MKLAARRPPRGIEPDPLLFHSIRGQVRRLYNTNWAKVIDNISLTNASHTVYLRDMHDYLRTVMQHIVGNTRTLYSQNRLSKENMQQRLFYAEKIQEIISLFSNLLARLERAGVPQAKGSEVSQSYRNGLVKILSRFSYVPSVGFGQEKDIEGNVVGGPLRIEVEGKQMKYNEAFAYYQEQLRNIFTPVFTALGPVGRFRGNLDVLYLDKVLEALKKAQEEVKSLLKNEPLREIVADSLVSREAEHLSIRQTIRPRRRISLEMLKKFFRYIDPITNEELTYEEALHLREGWRKKQLAARTAENKAVATLLQMLLSPSRAEHLSTEFLEELVEKYPDNLGVVATRLIEKRQRGKQRESLREREVSIDAASLSEEDVAKLSPEQYERVCINPAHSRVVRMSWDYKQHPNCAVCGTNEYMRIRERGTNKIIGKMVRTAVYRSHRPKDSVYKTGEKKPAESEVRMRASRLLEIALLNKKAAEDYLLQIKVLDASIERAAEELGRKRAQELEVRKWSTDHMLKPLGDLELRIHIALSNIQEGQQILSQINRQFESVVGGG